MCVRACELASSIQAHRTCGRHCAAEGALRVKVLQLFLPRFVGCGLQLLRSFLTEKVSLVGHWDFCLVLLLSGGFSEGVLREKGIIHLLGWIL